MEGQAEATTTTACSRDLLHRSIYDYFRWCSVNHFPSKTTASSQQPVAAPGNDGLAAPDLNDVTPLALENFGSTVEQQQAEVSQNSTGASQSNTADSASAAVEAYPEPPALQLGDTATIGAEAPPALKIPVPADPVWQAKYQRVLAVLEQEFPEMLQLPAEQLEGKTCSDLELRFLAHPDLEKRERVPEPSSLEGKISEIPLHPTETVPAATLELTTLEGAAAAADAVVGAALAGVGLPLGNAAGKASVEDILNTSKRKAPPIHSDDQDQQTSKRLKAQAREIKTLKSQLQQLKRTQPTGGVGKMAKKARGGAAVSRETALERAQAAAVPFEERLQELVHFSKGHGHCRVPCTSTENPGLARWVQSLRSAYKEKKKRGNLYYGQLTDERMAKLEKIGFEWSVQAPKASWEKRFQELVQFKQEHGHCRVVRSYPKNPSLGEWCHRQRFLAHKNQLDEHKVQRLTDLGFEIWVRKQGKSWEDHFEMLLEHRRKHENLKVPPPDTRTQVNQVLKATPTSSEAGENKEGNLEVDNAGTTDEGGQAAKAASEEGQDGPPSLDPATEEYKEEQGFRRWVVAQRDNYHLKFKKGIKSTLNKARVKKLESIGFDWTREGGENDLRKIRTGALHHRNDPEIWQRRFQELVEYKKRFGDTNIPKEWPENKSLGAWVATQRKMYKALLAGDRSSLTPERQLALQSIGFTWILRPARTSRKILEIEGLRAAGGPNII